MAKKTKADLENDIRSLQEQLLVANRRIQIYEQHVKSCRTPLPITPPPDHHHDKTSDHHHNETSVRPTLEQTPAHKQGSTNTNARNPPQPRLRPQHQEPNSLTSIQDTSDGKVPQKRKKWETDAKGFLANVKKPRYEPLKVASCHDGIIAAIVFGMQYDIQALPTSPITDPIAAGRRYANITRASRERAEYASRIASFQELIFHSMCVVLEYCGHAATDIDELMRITSSNSSPKNLKRLKEGAIWAHKVNSDLTGGEWTDLSSCIAWLYFEFNVKMSVYGSLADSKTTTIPHVVTALKQFQFENMPQLWCIPAFIRILLPAREIPLESICHALRYNATSAQRIEIIVSKYKDSINRITQQRLSESPMVDSTPPGPSKFFPPTGNGQTPSAGKLANSSEDGSAGGQEHRSCESPNGAPLAQIECTSAISLPDQIHGSTSNESTVFVGDCPDREQLTQTTNMEGQEGVFMGGEGTDKDQLPGMNLQPKPPYNLSMEMDDYDDLPPLFNNLPPLFNIGTEEFLDRYGP